MLESNFASDPAPQLILKARYILTLRPALGRPRLPRPPQPFLAPRRTCLPALLTVILFRRSHRRSFLLHTRQGRTRAPRRSSPASENYYASGSQLQGGSYGGRVGGGYEQQQYDSHSLPHPQSRSSRPPLHSLAGMPPLGNPSSNNAAAYTNSGMDHWRTKIGGQ